jgi:hypothetical protein
MFSLTEVRPVVTYTRSACVEQTGFGKRKMQGIGWK